MSALSLKNPILSAVAFFWTLGILSVSYSAYVSSYPATATAGTSQLSATEWNKMVTALQTLDGKLSTFSISAAWVGIWPASPTTALEIGNGGTVRWYVKLNNDSVNSPVLQLSNGLAWGRTYNIYSGFYSNTWAFVISDLTAGNVGRIAMDWSWNVGIGTMSPQAALDVNGKIKMQVDATANASTADTVPESYKFSRADCNSTTRWSMFVGRFTWDAGQDGLCVCMDVNAVMEWVCFNP